MCFWLTGRGWEIWNLFPRSKIAFYKLPQQENFFESDFDDDAVALLAVSYKKLGQDGLSQDARRVLESNYPEHPYLTGNWPSRRSRWNHLNPYAGEIEN